ncbi:MAG: hypothetical protein HZA28_00130 [Candidatus Omnitrophica bacterium]|nr:hypothetical protein [Candidatus Omnitrophota bacterium]
MNSSQSSSRQSELKDFLLAELEHAHSVNALVDNQRFTLLNIAVAFHAAIVAAVILGRNVNYTLPFPNFGGIVSIALLLIGLFLFAIYVGQHKYMRSCKRWISAAEARLLETQGLCPRKGYEDHFHRGTLYHDDNAPHMPLEERTFLFSRIFFLVLNCFTASLAGLVLGVEGKWIAVLFLAGVLLHFWVLQYTIEQMAWFPPIKRETGNSVAPFFENATQLSDDNKKERKGWILGHFFSCESPFHSTHIAIKWSKHTKGECREMSPKSDETTLTMLIWGKFEETFEGGPTFVLEREGDFVLWGPGYSHTWVALEDSLMLTIRWPSKIQTKKNRK